MFLKTETYVQKEINYINRPPASGKSTFAKQYIQEHPDTKIVSRDEIRHRFGEYNHNHEKEVNKIEFDETIRYMEDGFEIINDATNLHKNTRNKFENLAKQYNYNVEYKEFYVPLNVAIERDKNLDRGHHIGEEVIKRMYQKYYPNK